MTRNAVILIFVFALIGAAFYSWVPKRINKPSNARDESVSTKLMTRVLCVTRTIPQGAVFTSEMLEERLPKQGELKGAFHISQIVGRTATYTLEKGEVVTFAHLDPNPLGTVVRASKVIPPGVIVERDSVEELLHPTKEAPGALNSAWVLGRRATREVHKGEFFSSVNVDLEK